MIQKILLSIILLFVSVNPISVEDVPQGQVALADIDEYVSILENVGYEKEGLNIRFGGSNVPVFDLEGKTYALVSSNVDERVGTYDFSIRNGSYTLFSKEVDVVKYDFPKVYQEIAYSPAGLTATELEEINKTKETLFEALDRRTDEKLWETPFQYPLENIHITSDYGRKRIYTNYETQHKGTDFRASVGTSLKPMSEGRVLWTAKDPLYFEGKAIVIDHGQGIASIYMHLNEVLVDEGDFVEIDDVIGRTGNTGLSTGPHLHLDMRIGENRVDPVGVIENFKKISP